MDLEVRERHLARGDQRGDRRQQPECDQQTAGELDDTGRTHLAGERHAVSAEHAEQLLGTVAGEEQASDDSEESVCVRSDAAEAQPDSTCRHTLRSITDRADSPAGRAFSVAADKIVRVTSLPTDQPSTRQAWIFIALAAAIAIYGALLRLDVLVSRYGIVDHPRWIGTIERLAPVTRPLTPAVYAWRPVANPYVGGDPFSYVRFARDMRSFYQAHVREPVFLALTRVWLWLADGQDIGISFASLTGSVAAIFGTYLMAAAACSPAVGLLAAAALAIDFDAVSWAPDGWRDDTFTATVVFAMWALVRLRQRPTPFRAIVAGCLSAAACLTRLTALSFVVPALVWIALDGREARRERTRACLLTAGVVLLLVAPYMINCYRAYGDPFIAVNVHTRYYRFSEGLPSERPESALHYLGGKFGRRPLYELDTAIEGLFVQPLANKWSGYNAWLQGSAHALELLAVAGLVLLAFTADGRLLLVACFTSLIPFAFTWNIGGGREWRFTMHAYPFFLTAAFLTLVVAVRALFALRPGSVRPPLPRRRDLVFPALVALTIAAIVILRRELPYYVVREALGTGQAVTLSTGLRDDQFFSRGWSRWHEDGNVTARVTIGDRSIVTIPLPASKDYFLTLRADPVQAEPNQTLTLYFNRRFLRTLPLEWDPTRVGTYRLTVPAGYGHAGTNELLIVPGRTIRARDAGERFSWISPDAAIGARVWYVRVEPLTEAAIAPQ